MRRFIQFITIRFDVIAAFFIAVNSFAVTAQLMTAVARTSITFLACFVDVPETVVLICFEK